MIIFNITVLRNVVVSEQFNLKYNLKTPKNSIKSISVLWNIAAWHNKMHATK